MTALDRFIAFSLPGYLDAGIPIAASRAGALGILDLEFESDRDAALTALHALSDLGKGKRGVKLSLTNSRFGKQVLEDLPDGIGDVVLTGATARSLSGWISSLHDRDCSVFVEAFTVGSAVRASRAGADAVILKGNEAGGHIGHETAFVLLQRCIGIVDSPLWVQGGIGVHTAAACIAAGAAGVVLDWQLALTRESSLSDVLREHVASKAGADTMVLGDARRGEMARVHSLPRSAALDSARKHADTLAASDLAAADRTGWHRALADLVGGTTVEALLLLSQDAAFASRLATRYVTTAGVLTAIAESIPAHISVARDARPLDEHGPLAEAHGTRYPILQGPMTRVSDVAPFCDEVCSGGALPFLALALMRGPEVDDLLRETSRRLADRSWGVGILGFVPADLREEQLEHVRRYRPPFAIIAGGRPDQADALEREGITTYLHVPSPELLDSFLKNGSRRFVFEGSECGGHIGPRTSFVLWESMIEVLLEHIETGQVKGSECQIVFAGGIHDHRSSAMVAVLTAALVEHGAKVGVLMGTAYLFTQEAVACGAIVEGFQRQAMICDHTAVLELTPGHAIRCVESRFVATFDREKANIIASGQSRPQVEDAVEDLIVGKLRLASKGVKRADGAGGPDRVAAPAEEQLAEGFFMIGQVAALRDELTTIADLHRDVSVGGSAFLSSLDSEEQEERSAPPPCDIAIVGMAALLPKANNIQEYWRNIVNRVDAVTEVPPARWDPERYFDPDRFSDKDRTYSKWGGFLSPIPFDPVSYGMPPASVNSIDPIQLLALETARAALADAGYSDRPFDRERTSVIIGAGGNGGGDLGTWYGFRTTLPGVFGDRETEIAASMADRLPTWTEDSFAGILPNVVAGRIANRFNLGGTNLTIDAACASSLASMYLAVHELRTGVCNMAIAGGADTSQNAFAYICFSKTQALSPNGHCRTFDEDADGIATSEGLAMVVLKRLEDAERDGDRIYAVIKGIGGSSDGRDKGLTAPRAEGQMRALERAYAQARISPASVDLVEAHGTGTVVGDRTEVDSLTRFWSRYEPRPQSCALGSVKSMIGHTKASAGAAGVIKTTLALHDKVLPPTLGVEKPNSRANFRETPFYVNSETRPWVRRPGNAPRRAGVSAFGFGGTNFHVVLEEYTSGISARRSAGALEEWSSELFIWRAKDRTSLGADLSVLQRTLEGKPTASLADLAYSVCAAAESQPADAPARLAIVAQSVQDLLTKVKAVILVVADASKQDLHDPGGVFFSSAPSEVVGKLAFLFSGQGSQYPDMGKELALCLPEARHAFERADAVLEDRFDGPLSSRIFPPPAFTPEEKTHQRQALVDTHVAQPALGAMETALYSVLRSLDLAPEMVAGHSYGEFVALWAAGALETDDLYLLSEARGRCMSAAGNHGDAGTMAAVSADSDTLKAVLAERADVVCANFNSPRQTVISGTHAAVAEAIAALSSRDIQARELNVACAFHSPLVAEAQEDLAETLRTIRFARPAVDVYSNTTGQTYPIKPEAMRARLTEHMIRPVDFVREIENMYRAGARVFLEVGPGTVLTGLVGQILGDRPHTAIATDVEGRSGVRQLQLALARLCALGIPFTTNGLFTHRDVRRVRPGKVDEQPHTPPGPTTWLVDGGKAVPARDGDRPRARAPRFASQQEAPSPSLEPASSRARASQPSGSASVMTQFQQLMNRFLETQESVMLAYLGSGKAPTLPASDQLPAPPDVMPARQATPVATVVSTTETPVNDQAARALVITHEGLTARLLEVVADRTGYPPEMLGLDIDIEADLGIDSIKRIEILVGFQDLFGEQRTDDTSALEELTQIRTLGGIVEWILSRVEQQNEGPSGALTVGEHEVSVAARPEAEARLSEPEMPATESIGRYLLRVADAPPIQRGATFAPGTSILITDDGGGAARLLSQKLTDAGLSTAILGLGDVVEEIDSGRFTCPFDEDGIAAAVDLIKARQGTIAGIVHLLPLRPAPDLDRIDLREWRVRLAQDVEGLFHIARRLSDDLRGAAVNGGSAILAVSGLGGSFGFSREESIFPGHGGVAGFAKSLAREWPDVRIRAVDVDPGAPSADIAARLHDELLAHDSCVEVGYAGERRVQLELVPSALDSRPQALSIEPSDVILLTGGARGITSTVARGLARRYRPTLILTGTTPEPGTEEEPRTASLTSSKDLRAAIADGMCERGEKPVPSQVEAECLRILKDREIRQTLRDLREAGSSAWYVQLDMRDEPAVESFLAGVYERFGRLDGVVHGAGVIADKLIGQKDPVAFRRVFSTKVDSALLLTRHVRLDVLKFLVFFSSVSGRVGNRGQTDYSAANEILGKLALRLDRTHGPRIAAIEWGPWEGGGMVTPELRRLMLSRGATMIASDTGERMFDAELRFGRKGESDVVVGGWSAVEPPPPHPNGRFSADESEMVRVS